MGLRRTFEGLGGGRRRGGLRVRGLGRSPRRRGRLGGGGLIDSRRGS